ncbi:ornithine carbamoyltransferase [Thermoflavimicrobium daqui]|jgi:ornithine carbamoyltransferase|uniref:Ornithine carbamoyltransferase n=1 Tax=Thermoflavimicrobium daqui TaxID=2137476 RepID=A0A364K0Y6_9BACL|nr:ornithine carbamoyltransferase [Thermoflavimicrobium daqui]RAL21359.1 ornithine carbamoyltransferase [Thermoflavimicrobium daqui]
MIDFALHRLKGKDCLTLTDFSSEEIKELVELAAALKQKHQTGEKNNTLQGKVLALLFDKASTRTRVSFAVGMVQLGGHFLELSQKDLQYGRGESLADTARTLSGYVDAIMIRTFDQQMVEELAKYATIPVINGLTDLYHPCQTLADLLTLKEEKGDLSKQKVTYLGDGNNVLHSLMHGAAAVGMHLAISTPSGYEPLPKVWEETEKIAEQTGAKITFHYDPIEAVQEADAVYTDVWASMGQEEEKEKRKLDFKDYQVNEALMKHAKPNAIFMHCLPAYRGLEVSAGIIDGPQSVVFSQAENRLHAQKALLLALLQ